MIDIHSHVIYEIDDGSRSYEESLSILKKMNKIGYRAMVCTPHYITGSKYVENNFNKFKKIQLLREFIRKENLNLHLYLGNEIYIDPEIESLINAGEVYPINRSRYLLIEFPVSRLMNDLMNLLFLLRSKGYVPIIAHPERYLYLQDNHDLLDKFLEMGCLFQGNFSCIIGKYGEHTKKLFLYMLKNNYYHFLATDVHHETDILFLKFNKIKKMIIKEIDETRFKKLTYVNPLKVIRNEPVDF
ncbi:MAG: hypothetical protein HFJ02_02600 [Bacilli bacterium]|nr:hypothetical protein [Bacilli bacterium]